MPVVHIPAALRQYSGDRTRIEVPGANLRQVFAALERQCPGIGERIIADDDLRTDMAVAIDGNILEGGGLIEPVRQDAEIYLVPPIGGGARRHRSTTSA
jgi:molybdopterin converting factor small subunit